jgi:6-pyruvoyltetrahydropterin/6-carboxytetrahydropterin synthase
VSYRVTVSARFEAAHFLIHYRGQPEPLHGHSYRVEAAFGAPELDGDDLAIDFVEAKRALDAVVKEFNYTNLNDHTDFRGQNTSAENLARYVAGRLAKAMPLSRVEDVTVWEGPENRASFSPR